jgi:hypothetical protein
LHTQEYAKEMNRRLQQADRIGGKDEVLNEMEKIRSEMEGGTFSGHKL